MQHSPWEWAIFGALVLAMLVLDLGVFHRKEHVVRPREALAWTVAWVTLALGFGAYVWLRHGSDTGLEYLTGYVVEESLSVDNMFVFVVIFGSLGIPPIYQHRVLFWGILSAVVLRGAMIAGGAALLARFHWVMYAFGGFLFLTGVKLLFQRSGSEHPEKSAVFRLMTRVVPGTPRFHGHAFFVLENGRRVATPLFFALVTIEVTDVMFAVDSIPAIFAVTQDPFVVFTSNIFAILGLRSLYFLLAGFIEKFTYLKPSLAAILVFVGTKMTIVDVVKIHPAISLAVVVGILAIGIAASALKARKDRARARLSEPAARSA